MAASEATRLVDEARAVRGVLAAAVLGADGEVLAAAGEGAALLERMQRTATNALAAAEAFASLLDGLQGDALGEESDDPAGSGASEEQEAESHLTVLYQDVQPLLFEPLAGGDKLLVVAVESSADIGRARFHLRRLRNR
jgi:predicted regulator of Ras-like GTPase activity (Roadblock/LC7/MglB family)